MCQYGGLVRGSNERVKAVFGRKKTLSPAKIGPRNDGFSEI